MLRRLSNQLVFNQLPTFAQFCASKSTIFAHNKPEITDWTVRKDQSSWLISTQRGSKDAVAHNQATISFLSVGLFKDLGFKFRLSRSAAILFSKRPGNSTVISQYLLRARPLDLAMYYLHFGHRFPCQDQLGDSLPHHARLP